MSALGSLVVSIALDHAQYTQGLDRSSQQALAFAKNAQTAADKAEAAFKRGFKEIAASTLGLTAGVAGVVALTASLSRSLDQNTKNTAQLKLATSTQQEYNRALEDVNRIAKTAQADVSAITTLYARLTQSLDGFGATQKQIADVTEVVNLGLKINGSTTAEAASAMLQLSQAFGSGVLRGEEFNAMSESALPLMKALAASMGVTVGELRALASEGKITTDVMLRAFSDPALLESFRTQAKEMSTISGGVQEVKNASLLLVEVFDNVTKASGGVSDALGAIAEKIEALARGINRVNESAKLPEFQKILKIASFFQKGPVDLFASSFDKLTGAMDKSADSGKKLQTVLGKGLASDTRLANGQFAAPNFSSTIEAQNVDKINQKQQEAAKRISEINQKSADDAKRRYQERLKELQQELLKEEETELASKNFKIKMDKEAADTQAKLDAEAYDRKIAYYDLIQSQQDIINRENQKAEEELERQHQENAQIVQQSITDALFRAFESGKDFAEAFKRTLINTFQTLVLRPLIEFAVNSSGLTKLLGSFGALGSAGANASTGGSASNIFGSLKDVLNSGNNALVGSIEQLGVLISNGNGKLADTIGGFLGANAGAIADIAPYAGSIISLLQGDFKGAAFSGAGTAIGGALGGPIGAAIGGALGSVVGGLFGGKDLPKRGGGSANASFSNGVLRSDNNLRLDVDRNTDIEQALSPYVNSIANTLSSLDKAFGGAGNVNVSASYSGRDGGSGYRRLFANLGGNDIDIRSKTEGGFGTEDFQSFLGELTGSSFVQLLQASNLPNTIKSIFNNITDSNEVSNAVQAIVAVKNSNDQLVKSFGVTADQAFELASNLGLTGSAVAVYATQLAQAANDTRTFGDDFIATYDRLMANLTFIPMVEDIQAYDKWIASIDKSTKEGFGNASLLLNNRADFLNYSNAINNARSGVTSATFDSRTLDEQAIILRDQISSIFAQINAEAPTDLGGLLSLADNIDYTTKSGYELAVAMPTLVDAFKQLESVTKETTDSVISQVNDYRNLIDSNNFTDRASFETAQAFAAQGLNAVYNSSDANENGKLMVGELQLLRTAIAELIEQAKQTATNTLSTTRVLNSVTDGASLITTAG